MWSRLDRKLFNEFAIPIFENYSELLIKKLNAQEINMCSTITTTGQDILMNRLESANFTISGYMGSQYDWGLVSDAESIISEDEMSNEPRSFAPCKVKSGPSYQKIALGKSNYNPSPLTRDTYKLTPSLETSVTNDIQSIPSYIRASESPKTALANFFCNELFFATNLSNLRDNFLNFEFDSFSQSLILYPLEGVNVEESFDSVHSKLKSLSQEVDSLVTVIHQFNLLVNKACTTKVDIYSLMSIKQKLNKLIKIHLGDGLHIIIDNIINLLYDYNQLVEDIHLHQKSEPTSKSQALLDYQSKIENTLQLSESINQSDVVRFSALLEARFIGNKEWWNVLDHDC